MGKNVFKYDEMKRSEHMAVRKTAGWYLWTHQLVEVKGEDAVSFLEGLYTGKISSIKVGADRYTTMLNEAGEIIDDVVIMRTAEDAFWVSTLYAPQLLAWMKARQGNAGVTFEDITENYHMYAVQGPLSGELVNAVVDKPVDGLKFFTFCDNTMDGIPVKVNRAGFTGEKLGYEIYIARDQMAALEKKLQSCGEPLGAKEVTEFQVLAWTLPTEAGFYHMRDLLHTNPFEVGMTRGIDWEKEFVGKAALEKIREEGPCREMLGFYVDEADTMIHGRNLGGPGDPVMLDGEEIGRVYKFVYSYVLDKNIGYILADKGAVQPGDCVRIREYDAVICDKPFI